MTSSNLPVVPSEGAKITRGSDGKLDVPNRPIIPFIEGDGIGPDIWAAAVRVFDSAVDKSYGGEKKIAWMEVYAGEIEVLSEAPELPSGSALEMDRNRRRAAFQPVGTRWRTGPWWP